MNKQERWFWSLWDLKLQTERLAAAPVALGIAGEACSLYSYHRRFARVHYLNSRTIAIESKTEWSDKAGITQTSVKQTADGWNGKPSVWWYVNVEDSLEMTEVLVKLIRVRRNTFSN